MKETLEIISCSQIKEVVISRERDRHEDEEAFSNNIKKNGVIELNSKKANLCAKGRSISVMFRVQS